MGIFQKVKVNNLMLKSADPLYIKMNLLLDQVIVSGSLV